MRHVCILCLHRTEIGQKIFISRIGFGMTSDSRAGRVVEHIAQGIPLKVRLVDYFARDTLVDDPLDDRVYHSLLFQSVFRVRIVAFDLISQPPVRDQFHIAGKECGAVRTL